MWQPTYVKTDDVEIGDRLLYPVMHESPELRWSFIRKVYSILSIQLLLTIAVASVVVSVRPISHFFVSSGAGLAVYILIIVTPFIVLCPLQYYYRHHPVNLLLLALFTTSLAFAVGLTCAFTSDLKKMNWIQRKIYLYNVTFGLYMLDWWERQLFNILMILLLWFICYNGSRSATEFYRRYLKIKLGIDGHLTT